MQKDATLAQSVTQFNEQLLLFAEAGIPLGFDLSPLADGPADAVRQIEVILQQDENRGLEGLVAAEELSWQGARDRLPPAYVQLVEAGIRIGSISAVWKQLQRAEAPAIAQATQLSLVRTWVYPAICGVVAYLGFVILCWNTVPQLQQLAYESQIQEGLVLRGLGRLHGTLRWWAPVVPALVIGGIAVARRRPSELTLHRIVSRRRWIPFQSHDATRTARAGQFAAVASLLHRHQLPLAEVLERASVMTSVCCHRGASHASAQEPSLQASCPPLLRWAIERYTEDEHWSELLDAVSVSYRRLAEQKAQQSKSQRPILFGLIVGGTVALLYGLALFVPMADLLEQLASSIASASGR